MEFVLQEGSSQSYEKKKRKKITIMKMSLRIQERISWPGFLSK